tara:strand:+ start:1302 stop:1859 length:558 start_codon:yes stop_codon:yes gene_type:complete
MKPKFDIVVAHDSNHGIGYANQLAWHLPEDMAFFKQLTMGKYFETKPNIVIMGRKTYDSIPKNFRPLKNRINIVLTQSNFKSDHDDVKVASSVEDAFYQAYNLVRLGKADHIFCIGGKSIYETMMHLEECRYLYVTYLDGKYECDAFFPEYTQTFERINCSEKHTSTTGITYQFQLWQSRQFNIS